MRVCKLSFITHNSTTAIEKWGLLLQFRCNDLSLSLSLFLWGVCVCVCVCVCGVGDFRKTTILFIFAIAESPCLK